MQGSLRALSFYISAGLCFISFFMMFISPIAINEVNLSFLEVYFGKGTFESAIGGFIGFIFLLPAIALLLVLSITINIRKKLNDTLRHTLEIILLVSLFLAIILMFCCKPLFMSANNLENDEIVKLGYGPLIAGLMTLFAFALAAFGLVIPID